MRRSSSPTRHPPGSSCARSCARGFPSALAIALGDDHEASVAVAAIDAGAFDYLTTPVTVPVLELAFVRALGYLSTKLELARLHDAQLDDRPTAAAFRRALELADDAATGDAAVLVTGEAGAGKERLARLIHDRSPRAAEPFVTISCAALTPRVLARERAGLFAHAARGTILFDEIADVPLDIQAKLVEIPFAARAIATTTRDLAHEVARGRFREDLMRKIAAIAIHVPPLRERGDDILPLARQMLKCYATRIGKPVQVIAAAAEAALADYRWPGNVRELENCMERAVAVCTTDQISVDDLPERFRMARLHYTLDAGAPQFITLSEMKQRYLRVALDVCRGNKSLAARTLAIDRRTISHLLGRQKTEKPNDVDSRIGEDDPTWQGASRP